MSRRVRDYIYIYNCTYKPQVKTKHQRKHLFYNLLHLLYGIASSCSVFKWVCQAAIQRSSCEFTRATGPMGQVRPVTVVDAFLRVAVSAAESFSQPNQCEADRFRIIPVVDNWNKLLDFWLSFPTIVPILEKIL